MVFIATQRHVARIAYLAGAGCTIAEIMEDLGTNDNNTIKWIMEQNYIEAKTGPRGTRTLGVQVTAKQMDVLRDKAGRYDIVGADRCRMLLQRIVGAVAGDPVLIDNLLDEGVSQ